MGRTALFVDIELGDPNLKSFALKPEFCHVLRIANTHLESLPQGQRERPVQLAAIASVLRQRGVRAGLVAGDMNVISPADEHIHVIAELEDACGAKGASQTMHTWGYQPRCQFPPGRLDRVFFVPGTLETEEEIEVIGKGVRTQWGAWASDHYGLKLRVSLPVKDSSQDIRPPRPTRRRHS